MSDSESRSRRPSPAPDRISTAPPEVFEDDPSPSNTPSGPPQDPEVVAEELAYRVLTCLHKFRNKDVEEWWNNVSPALVIFMGATGYGVHLQYHYLRFFRDYVYPSIGQIPRPGRTSFWESTVTPMAIPASLWIRRLGDADALQFSFEPINAQTGTVHDRYNRFALRSALGLLQSGGLSFNMELYCQFAQDLIVSDDDVKFLNTLPQPSFKLSQSIITLDLRKNLRGPLVECSLSPFFKAVATRTPAIQLIYNAVKVVDPHEGTLATALSVVVDYWNQFGGDSKEASLLTWNMVDPCIATVRIHITEWDVCFDRIKDFWTLGGTRSGEYSTEKGLWQMSSLWHIFHIPSGDRRYGVYADDTDPSAQHRSPLLFCFELVPNDPRPNLTVYFPVDGVSCARLSHAVDRLYDMWKLGPLKKKYRHCIDHAFNHKHMHAWISYSCRPGGTPVLDSIIQPLREFP